MIFAIREGVQTRLTDRGYPVSVDLAPGYPAARGAMRLRHLVLLERSSDADDSIEGAVGRQRNPMRIAARFCSHVASIYAHEPKAGALRGEHVQELDRVVDGVIVALHDWALEQGAVVRFTGGRVLTSDDIQGAEQSSVMGYRLQFLMGRSVDRRDYDGSGLPTADVDSVAVAARVTLDDDTYEEI